jgi:hypothetical protein
MGKHHDKVARALEKRIKAWELIKESGYKKPGSMNKKKTGYSR